MNPTLSVRPWVHFAPLSKPMAGPQVARTLGNSPWLGQAVPATLSRGISNAPRETL